ncbi:HsdM family class I SAM-dependent methyltransferase [Bacteroides acidifaciens]|uniref:HsdM family class I SAM-dependent methyltransferase n=1 Tax=Bacteroides acidifaciens TaxID=85831 RepID=UPI0025580CC1|nr:N-6 DNA methylase [Bacteroides acidifaciens]
MPKRFLIIPNLTDGTIKYEIGAYYISKNNLFVPKKIAEYTDLSFLLPQNIEQLLDNIANLSLTEEEIEAKKLQLEDDIERKLKEINQRLHDEQDIVVGSRVKLIAGLVMAGLGVKGKVSPLKVDDLRGELGSQINDGAIIMSRVSEYLQTKELPSEKRLIIENELRGVFNNSSLYRPINGESKLHTTYSDVKANIIPFLTGELHNLDFTGRMFNVLNAWVDVPDGDKNDVVLTPRYVTELMAKLCNVNMNSYVWDFATGSGGFLISAMHEMIADVKDKIKSPAEQEAKIAKIKMEQLLGIEKLSEIYMLAVLNMILMKDGSANIIKGNSLTDFMGTYEQGKHKGKEFPANVFLLNPPYSAEGKGFIFVEKALSLMHHGGMAAVLIQENAGSGNGTPYTKNILKNNTLVASIRMSDIFCGKASVQTAIYVFRVGEPHSTDSIVRFIDFSNDGYTRQNRKKSSQSVNLRDTGNAKERYAEVVKLVRHGKGLNDANLNFFVDGETYFEDQISLDGNDWTIQQHRKFNVIPSIEDFQKVVKDYLSWRVGEVLKNEGDVSLGKQ